MVKRTPGEVIGIDTHPDFESEAVSEARGRLRKLACEVPPRVVFELLQQAEAALSEGRRSAHPR